MTDEEAQGAGVAAWMLVRMLAGELAASGVVPPKRMRKLVSGLLEQARNSTGWLTCHPRRAVQRGGGWKNCAVHRA
jgi:hypothetical protein